MRGTKAKRFLLRPDVASAIHAEVALGVPVQRTMQNYGLTCSRPTLVKLLDAKLLAETNDVAKASLYPAWLDSDGEALQMQPEGWFYVGRFPLGEWQCCKNT